MKGGKSNHFVKINDQINGQLNVTISKVLRTCLVSGTAMTWALTSSASVLISLHNSSTEDSLFYVVYIRINITNVLYDLILYFVCIIFYYVLLELRIIRIMCVMYVICM